MHEKLIRQLSSQVADALAEQELACAPNRRAALALLKTPGWAEELDQLLPIRTRLECDQVLQVCAPILAKLSPVPEDGWPSATGTSAPVCTPRATSPPTPRNMWRAPGSI